MESFESNLSNIPDKKLDESGFYPGAFDSEVIDAQTLEGFDGVIDIVNALRGGFPIKGLDKSTAEKILDSGIEDISGVIAERLEFFSNLDHNWLANRLVDVGECGAIIRYISKFKDLTRETGQRILEGLNGFSEVWKEGDLSYEKAINNYFSPPLDRLIAKTCDIFGEKTNATNYNLLREIMDGKLSDDVESLGVKKSGEAGVLQLEQAFQAFKADILQENFDLKKIESSPILLDFLKNIARFEESEWGSSEDDDLKDLITNFTKYKEEGVIQDLDEQFKASEITQVNAIDKEAQSAFKYSEHFLNRYKVIAEDIETAKELYQEKFPISKMISSLEDKVCRLLENLQERFSTLDNPKAEDHLEKRIEALSNLSIRNLEDFQSNFHTLSQHKELHQDLRQAMFLMGFAKNRRMLNAEVNKDVEKPTLDDVSWTLNFVDHITNQETMAQYFTDKSAKRSFEEIISTKALQEEMTRAQNQGTKGTVSMQFRPTRGLLMELSGHIADACWASKYDSIAKEFPNFTAITMVQNPDNKYIRPAGSCMLIETESQQGEKLLVIRGLNPLENIINGLQVEDFYNQFTVYTKDLAEKTGRKVAIVIDSHVGGASTNRPVLFNFLNNLELKKIILNDEDTNFNGYDITKNTYLI